MSDRQEVVVAASCQESAAMSDRQAVVVAADVRTLSDSEEEVEFVDKMVLEPAGEDAGDSLGAGAQIAARVVHVVTPGKRQAVVRSKLQPSGPLLPSRMSMEDLALLELDLMEMRQLIDRMEQLRSAHCRNWDDSWWARFAVNDLQWEWNRQKREFLDAVARGDVTERQRSYLLHRVGTE